MRPKLKYASAVWSSHQAYLITALEAVQNKATRFIHSSYSFDTSISPLKAALPVLPFIISSFIHFSIKDRISQLHYTFPTTPVIHFKLPTHHRMPHFLLHNSTEQLQARTAYPMTTSTWPYHLLLKNASLIICNVIESSLLDFSFFFNPTPYVTPHEWGPLRK